ncbi:MAG: hypothetical protein SGPRY_005081, partial [Prymnesium sp.]
MGSSSRGGIAFKPSEADGARGFGGGGWDFREYMAHKLSGLEAQYASRVQPVSSALASVLLHADGLTSSRQLALADLVTAHGGKYVQYLSSGVTHLVANKLPPSKRKAMAVRSEESRRRGRSFFVVREEWLLESARAGKRADERLYALEEIMPLAVVQHGDLISLNHLAKACGVTKHMSPQRARQLLCARHPGLEGGGVVHVPTDQVGRVCYRLYQEHSMRLLRLWGHLAREADANALLEAHPSSYDEAWIDVGHSDEKRAEELARRLAVESDRLLGFEVSVGVGRSKTVAKWASIAAKPPRATGGHPWYLALRDQDLADLLCRTPLERLPAWVGLTQESRERLAASLSARRGTRGGRREGLSKCLQGPSLLELRALSQPELLRALGEPGSRNSKVADSVGRLLSCLHGDSGSGEEHVRLRPPSKTISVACSLSVEPSCGVNARQPIDVREEAALRPRLESMALELLQRAALHAADFNLSPRTLGLTIALRRPLGGEGGGGGGVEGSFGRGRSARLRPRVVEALASGELRYSDLLTSRQMADAVGSVVEQSFLLMREAASSALPPSARTDTPRLVKHLTLSLGGFEAATPEAGGMMDIRKIWARGPPSPDDK